ncbi:uncharacterized protein FFUJ_07960 [Fusarium fujikuroi IMI 58289]|uniref:DUF2306 domain-containing protein n=1 Tax=Gibberella fujikuroi (strain CBS 195.34 / IMI 58289 / NRRL A-6831) TaxID=1279085 RepID=S0E2L0_GIBF5|nr:uncharacterized protein FFUJ_07960 [Fusarium fujikuroi IMI 58289]KLO98584.1 uncharacterized protein Y057_4064 [Fusarium fujikuroi]KLP07219.1 uncharacterized protein LW94_028 [Fusarium fujikuroi]CCT69026.1 uncharacterized protein FFUJ_07960 [Fusarium fujikuroi IMI 58289]
MDPNKPQTLPYTTRLQRIYRAFGFTKGYSFVLWFLFGGAFLAFTLSRFIYLDFDGQLCPSEPPTNRPYGSRGAVPGECYYYRHGVGKAGIIMHLAGILPAAVLVVFQFLPVIRHRALVVHRINGYIVLLLSTVGMIGVFMIARHTFGGTLEMQTVTGAASILFVTCMLLAYINIKKLQLEQHRAWMIRGWIIAILDSMFYHNKPAVEALYPDCIGFYTGVTPDQRVIIKGTSGGRPDEIAASLNSAFGASAWLALLIHTIAAELYLRLTSAESERLRKVSYRWQQNAGMKDPGNAGLTAQRLGDAEPWVCPDDDQTLYGDGESFR